MRKELSPKETALLRDLYWKLQELQGEMQAALNEVAERNGCGENEKWNATPDFKYLVRVQ